MTIRIFLNSRAGHVSEELGPVGRGAVDWRGGRQIGEGCPSVILATDPSTYLVCYRLPSRTGRCLMRALSDLTRGIGLSLLRNLMWFYDCSHHPNTYDDPNGGREDRFLTNFSFSIRKDLCRGSDRAGLQTNILGYEHNWDRTDRQLDLIDMAGGVLDGIACCWYDIRPESQAKVSAPRSVYGAYVTEGSEGEWIPRLHQNLARLMSIGIEFMRQKARCLVLWNLTLDEKGGQVISGFGTSTCRDLVTEDRRGRITSNLDYCGLARFSRFIRPGDRRISMEQADYLSDFHLENTDGSQVAVLYNRRRRKIRIGVRFVLGRRSQEAEPTLWTVMAVTLVCGPGPGEGL